MYFCLIFSQNYCRLKWCTSRLPNNIQVIFSKLLWFFLLFGCLINLSYSLGNIMIGLTEIRMQRFERPHSLEQQPSSTKDKFATAGFIIDIFHFLYNEQKPLIPCLAAWKHFCFSTRDTTYSRKLASNVGNFESISDKF